MKKQYKVGSLFAGVGGICLGFMNAKNQDGECVMSWANEVDEFACETYRTNFDHTLLQGDINMVLHPENSDNIEYYKQLHEKILAEPIDILNGGFPCQAFSIAGEQKGFNDDRGNLFMSFIDLINQLDKKFKKKPRILFLENVKNLKAHDQGRTYQIIKTKLEESGYIIKEMVMNTMFYSDLPQNRERIYIIGFLNKKDADQFTMFDNLTSFQKKKGSNERAEDVKKIIDYSIEDKAYFYTKDKYPRYFISKKEFNSLEDENNIRIHLTESITEMYQFYQLRRGQYVRKNQSNVCPTLTANMGTGGHNVPLILTPQGIRKITPSETFKLQGFPVGNGYSLPTTYKGKAYLNSQLYKQAGNAVSVPIITLIAEQILKAIT
ncbi:DNA (cytosine-5-)-methyltransferase [Mycoplasma tullyi]|uniref:Cytosine-specific methyltransferase n=2 Tax=Mycoplasma tullyi TaxID=1612150 RepID=A0A7D7U539_9MOLU|nr:DNA (cytosine-5-)-methyltransferase [Mycoplasma tullyi]